MGVSVEAAPYAKREPTDVLVASEGSERLLRSLLPAEGCKGKSTGHAWQPPPTHALPGRSKPSPVPARRDRLCREEPLELERYGYWHAVLPLRHLPGDLLC